MSTDDELARPDAVKLPAAVQDYFALMAEPDKRRVISLFSADAVVTDDGKTYAGRDAVLDWLDGPASEYTSTSTVLAASSDAGALIVAVLLEGNFPGERVVLRHHFETDSQGHVRALMISL